MALKEKLQSLQQQHASEADEANRALPDWQHAVAGLLAHIESDLEEYSRSGLMRLSRHPVYRREELLNSYIVDELRIDTAGGSVVVSPVARYVLGADGRVDLYRPGYRDAVYMLFWHRDGTPEGKWTIYEFGTQDAGQPYSKQQIEAAIERILG